MVRPNAGMLLLLLLVLLHPPAIAMTLAVAVSNAEITVTDADLIVPCWMRAGALRRPCLRGFHERAESRRIF